MADPGEFVDSLKISLWIIWASYSILGGITVLIYQQAGKVSPNVMEDLRGGEAAQEPLRCVHPWHTFSVRFASFTASGRAKRGTRARA